MAEVSCVYKDGRTYLLTEEIHATGSWRWILIGVRMSSLYLVYYRLFSKPNSPTQSKLQVKWVESYFGKFGAVGQRSERLWWLRGAIQRARNAFLALPCAERLQGVRVIYQPLNNSKYVKRCQ